jgi:hypothetical protein
MNIIVYEYIILINNNLCTNLVINIWRIFIVLKQSQM